MIEVIEHYFPLVLYSALTIAHYDKSSVLDHHSDALEKQMMKEESYICALSFFFSLIRQWDSVLKSVIS